MLSRVSIRALMTSIFSLNIVLLIMTVVVVFLVIEQADKLELSNKNRISSISLADEFRQSSDDLTRFARTYAVTGNDKYEKIYFDIIDIRDGKKPRPEKYDQVYWDLVLNYGDKPKPDGAKVSMADKMVELGFSDKELGFLEKAKEFSDELVSMEIEAMNAVKGRFKDANGDYTVVGEPNLTMAASILHSEKYHQAKAKIVQPVDEFLTELNLRVNGEVEELQAGVSFLDKLSIIFISITTLSSIIGYFVIKLKVINPLIKTTDQINAMSRDNDLTVRFAESKDEIGQVGSSLNALLKQLGAGIKRFVEAEQQISNTSGQVVDFVNSAETKGREQNEQLTMVATAMEEMVSTLKEVAASVNQASNETSQSEASAQKGKQSMDKTNEVFDKLIASFERSSATITELSEESNHMSNVLDVIKAIAEQTNLLALNAAIEAARAGEQGRGFAVVADEVRTLAQRSQESAGEIEQMLTQLQAKAKNATESINQSAQDMNDTKINIDQASEILTDISGAATQINHLNVSIATATEEQQAVSEDINANINKLHGLSNQSVAEMQDFLSVSNELQKVARETKKVTDQFKV